MADGSLTVTIIFAFKNRFDLKPIRKSLEDNIVSYNQWFIKSRGEHSLGLTINQENYRTVNKIMRNNNEFNIQSHCNLEITDEHKDNIEAFKRWTLNCFGILPTSFRKRGGAWELVYSNKILARYLIIFFGIVPGPKCKIAFEPELIKKSPLETRKYFARGVLMFDGSFTSSGKLTFSTRSITLFQSIKTILEEDGIKMGTKIKDDHIIYTHEDNEKQKFLSYFEKGTIKWLKVKDSYEIKRKNIDEIIKRYRKYSTAKVTHGELYKLIKNNGSCDWNYLAKHFNCSRHLLKPYLTVLMNSQLIKSSKTPKLLNEEYIDKNISILLKENFHNFIFKKIKEKFGTYENFRIKTDTHKSTISAWKLRKNRIPLSFLKRISEKCEINSSDILTNIQETDRKIIEII